MLDRFQETPGTPPVLRIDDHLSRDELASVFTACDVMLHPYRGEGFCMPVFEARACGLPVIATGLGPTDAAMEGPGCHRIEAARLMVDLAGAHVAQPWVLSPSVTHATERLLHVLENLDSEVPAARAFAPTMRASFSWEMAAQTLEEFAAQDLRRHGVQPAREPVVVLPPVARSEPVRSAEPVVS